MKKFVLLCIAAIFLFAACETTAPQTKTGKGAAYGAAGGAAAGAVIGQAVGKNTESTLVGAAVGAAVGGAVGAGAGKMMDNQEKELNNALAASKAASVRREGNLLAITLKGDFTFDTGSAKVKPGLSSEIERIANVMVQYPDTAIRVEGHTDSKGKENKNMELSKKRAEAVKALLVERGVNDARIKVIPFGESKPVADNKTDDGRRKNRRVEIKIEPAGEGSS